MSMTDTAMTDYTKALLAGSTVHLIRDAAKVGMEAGLSAKAEALIAEFRAACHAYTAVATRKVEGSRREADARASKAHVALAKFVSGEAR